MKNSEGLIKFASLFVILCAILSVKILWMKWLLPWLLLLLQSILFWRADLFSYQEKNSPKWRTYRFLIYVAGCFSMMIYYVSLIQDHLTFDPVPYLLLFFMIIFGNYAPKIPFNRTLGLRLPWTIHDDYTWRYAHRILGLWSFPCALLYLLGIVLPMKELCTLAFGAWFLIPSISSFQYHRKRRICE